MAPTRISPATHSHNAIAKLFLALYPTLSNAIPIEFNPIKRAINDTVSITKHVPLTETEFYIYSVTSAVLVLLGGVFAGLTLGLMGQDEVYLKVISSSGTESEKKCAKKVLQLLSRGKHWLLVTLLLSNVITNETLPVILDRLLGGGFAAVFSSTVAIVIFGEIIPQSVCVRYGLELGAFFAPYMLVLMYFMYPVAFPIAKLLDYLLGEDHGTFYRKNGLKTLVNLHHTMGTERLNIDEVTIISSVLDLKAKQVSEIMTPIDKVYTLPSNKVLDEKTVEEIFNAGFSRIPIHFPGEPTNFVGMLLVRILISYDPEDELPVSSFPLATLPETKLDTSCLHILNYFQEGKSHMVVVSETPGKDTGARGVLTLEDVIEELIGEEIVDESDVYVDVNKNIKREVPGPLSKRNVTSYLHKLYKSTAKRPSIASTDSNGSHKLSGLAYIKKDSYNKSRNGSSNAALLSNIKPSNLAADPLKTTNTHITIKKQPLLISPNAATLNGVQRNNQLQSLSPALSAYEDSGYGGTSENDADIDEQPQVHSSEAAALVQGIYENASRHTTKCDDPEECKLGATAYEAGQGKTGSKPLKKARRSFLGSAYGIPVPKLDGTSGGHNTPDSQESRSGSTGGMLVEDNIISLKGVSKTIIHDGTWKD
jgi:metal transporter CNNM